MNHQFFKTRKFRAIIGGLALIILLLVTFRAGMALGFRRAIFTMHWNDNYERNFFGRKPGMAGFGRRELMNTHGTVGEIIKVDAQTLTVLEREGGEKAVIFSKETAVKKADETIAPSDLKAGDMVAVLGSPNEEGQIEAKLIRVLPEAR